MANGGGCCSAEVSTSFSSRGCGNSPYLAYVRDTVDQARGGVRNTSGITPKRQARGALGHTSGFTAATACPRWGHHPELSSVATADAKLVVLVATADAERVYSLNIVATADAKNASPRRLTPNAFVIGIN
jgi:hypothetical protein